MDKHLTKSPKACSRLQRREYGKPLDETPKFNRFGGIQRYEGNIIAKEINFLEADFRLSDESEPEEVLPESAVVETSFLLSLNLPTVVKLIDVEVDKKQVKLFMPNLGLSIEEHLKKAEYTETEAKSIIFSALGTLAEIHNRGVIHGDIKADNFLLKERFGNPVLIDFGLSVQSVVLKDGTVRPVARVSGDPEFQALELQQEEREEEIKFTSKIDIWALALMWIRMIIPLDRTAKPSEEEIADIMRDYKLESEELKAQIIEDETYRMQTKLRSDINSLIMIPKTYQSGLYLLQKNVPLPLFEILRSMLEFDPIDRPSALELLNNPYFSNLTKLTLDLLSPFESISIREYHVRLNLNEKQLAWRSNHLIWLIDKCRYYSLSYRIYFLAIKLLDVVWSLDKKLISEDTPDVCLSLAQKFLYGHSPIEDNHAKDLGELMDNEIGDDKERYLKALDLEIKIYQLLCYNVNFSTAYDYFLLEEGNVEQRVILLTLLRTGLPLLISDRELAKAALHPIKQGSDLDNILQTELIDDFDWELVDE